MLLDLEPLPAWAVATILIAAAVAIGVAGTRLAGIADELADRTGLGEIIAGALFVGASTSLPGVITSVTTAAQGYPGLAIGNALGGLTAQTAFLAVADLAYRKANLEHATASVTGLTQGTLLVSLLTLPLLAMSMPEFTVVGVHPVSILLFVCYGFGLRLLSEVQEDPMWSPVRTQHTQDEAEQAEATDPDRRSTQRLWWVFAGMALVTAGAGYIVGETATALVEKTSLSQSAVGTVFAAVANSLPELVTALAAVQRGALNLAVGDIIGGNSFEVLFLAAADFFYREGSLYHEFTRDDVFIAVLAILMTGILLLGMLRRERHGIAGIGFESALVLALYVGSVVLLLAG
jgi:cation:H+ antiporter